MIVSERAWITYINGLRKINDTAANKITEYLETHGTDTPEEIKALLDYAYAVSTKYGEGAAELAAEMYDAIAEASGVIVPPAIPAQTAAYGEIAKAVQGVLKQSALPEMVASAVARQVKTAGVDTTMQNALRDGAEWAWIPHGETCAFCLTLASRGWQKASRNAIKGGHAEHIHANCDCTYAIRFDSDTEYRGYNPDYYRAMYDNADGGTPTQKINAMRREFYQENKEVINNQKKAAYEKRKELNSSAAEEFDAK